MGSRFGAGWSSPVARQAHNLKVVGSNPAPATNSKKAALKRAAFCCVRIRPARNVGDLALPRLAEGGTILLGSARIRELSVKSRRRD